jgi:hypothetical protein
MPPPLATVVTEPNGDLIRQILVALLTGTYIDGTPFSIPTTGGAGTISADVTDRSGRLLGHVTVDNASIAVTGTFWQATQPVSLATNTPDVTDRAARLLGHVTVDNASIPVTGTFWQATQPVSIAATITTKETRSSTPNSSFVNSNTSSIVILASNANRLGATLYNDSTQVAYVKLGVTASTTSYTIQMLPNSYYEVPFNYTGEIDAIWPVANGAMRYTELT